MIAGVVHDDDSLEALRVASRRGVGAESGEKLILQPLNKTIVVHVLVVVARALLCLEVEERVVAAEHTELLRDSREHNHALAFPRRRRRGHLIVELVEPREVARMKAVHVALIHVHVEESALTRTVSTVHGEVVILLSLHTCVAYLDALIPFSAVVEVLMPKVSDVPSGYGVSTNPRPAPNPKTLDLVFAVEGHVRRARPRAKNDGLPAPRKV